MFAFSQKKRQLLAVVEGRDNLSPSGTLVPVAFWNSMTFREYMVVGRAIPTRTTPPDTTKLTSNQPFVGIRRFLNRNSFSCEVCADVLVPGQ